MKEKTREINKKENQEHMDKTRKTGKE